MYKSVQWCNRSDSLDYTKFINLFGKRLALPKIDISVTCFYLLGGVEFACFTYQASILLHFTKCLYNVICGLHIEHIYTFAI